LGRRKHLFRKGNSLALSKPKEEEGGKLLGKSIACPLRNMNSAVKKLLRLLN
jgi:hypothetical protein